MQVDRKAFLGYISVSGSPTLEGLHRSSQIFGFDGWLPLYEGIIAQEDLDGDIYIVYEDNDKIITRRMERVAGKEVWSSKVTVYPHDNPPTYLDAHKVGIGERSDWYRPIEGVPRRKKCSGYYRYCKERTWRSRCSWNRYWNTRRNECRRYI